MIQDEDKSEEQPPVTLEDLFRKTDSLPKLYWLPLSPEQIAAKQKVRASQAPAKTTPKVEEKPPEQKAPAETRKRDETRPREEKHREEKPREHKQSRRG